MKGYRAAAEGCACFSLRKAARAVTQLYDARLRPNGLKATQFSLLVGLAVGGPITMQRLAERMVMDRTTLTRNVKPLQRAGLVKSTTGKDRRTRTLSLTGKGRKALARALPLWQQAQDTVLGRLGETQWQALRAALGKAAVQSAPD
ncbi:MAG: MarR family winged helix-turn-helix transcriptional regulator [Kiloniellales bacterium]